VLSIKRARSETTLSLASFSSLEALKNRLHLLQFFKAKSSNNLHALVPNGLGKIIFRILKYSEIEFEQAKKNFEKCKDDLIKFIPEQARVFKTIFGEVVEADPRTCAKNSEQLANLAYEFFSAWERLKKLENQSDGNS
jgi:hypothetical protein